MLPGFRFLFAAILLSASILVFGLGAAALLRASHEQYVSNPSWRNGPQEQVFAQAPEPAQPVLAVLRTEPEALVADAAAPIQIPSIGLPATTTAPEQMAAITREGNAEPEPQPAAVALEAAPATAEVPAPEAARREVALAAPTDTLVPADITASIAKTPVSATDVPRNATAALASRVTDIAAARVAALNDLTPVKTRADSEAAKPRASKPKKRHRNVRRPPPQPVSQALDPFGQPQQTLTATATRTR